MRFRLRLLLPLLFVLTSCSLPASTPAPEPAPATEALTIADTASATLPPPTATLTSTALPPTETFTPVPPTATATETPFPTVDSLKATVISDKIICRYGPGRNYLYLIAFNRNTPLRLIGRAPGNSWVLVQNEPQKCWVDSQFLELKDGGDLRSLKSMYPDGYTIPVSPYYGPTTVLSATREGDQVTVSWMEVIVSPGKYEDENMFPYIVEVWYCKEGKIVFDTLGSRVPFITFTDEPGCAEPSHGRVYIQEKHGFAGPADIPWPAP